VKRRAFSGDAGPRRLADSAAQRADRLVIDALGAC
jgi:hypothetical protein